MSNILVSACLVGDNCKYNGGNNLNKKVTELMDKYTFVPVCPEKLGGLSTPRPPAEIRDGMVYDRDGNDVTDSFLDGAKKVLEIARRYNCTRAILKANSPSCGCGEIYDGTFSGKIKVGSGICAALLSENGIEVITEKDIKQTEVWE